MEGNCVTGNCNRATTPSSVIISDITIDRTGLCINLLNIVFCLQDLDSYCLIN